MIVVFVSQYEIIVTTKNDDTRYSYAVDHPYQAAKIVSNMCPSKGFAWLDKNGKFLSSY